MDKAEILTTLDYRAFYETLIPALKDNGKAEVMAPCPFHNDHNPSLSVNLKTGLWNCFAGCGGGDVIEFYKRLKGVNFLTAVKEISEMQGIITANCTKPQVVARFEYKDAEGNVLYIKERLEPGRDGRNKEFVFKHRKNGQWVFGRGCEPVPYNLLELIKFKYAIIVEGEAKVDLLCQWGFVATCLDSGAKSPWQEKYLTYFAGKEKIVILPDNDMPGESYANNIAQALYDKVGEIKIVKLPNLPEKGDIIDWAKMPGNGKDKLTELIKNAVQRTTDKNSVFMRGHTLEKQQNIWPKADEDMYYGLAGDLVRTIEPHSEADPVALLVQFLACFGSVIGRGAYYEVEADKHYANIYTVMVGETSKGRKGTSWGHIVKKFRDISPEWAENRIQAGLSSGEGLIWAVRDPITKSEPIREKKQITGYQDVIVDQGEPDKRLLVLEAEFASTLRVLGRDGNILSAVVRQGWDKGNLRVLTKNNPATSSEAHISIIGHITREELLRYLTSTETGNDFANRFLWVCVKRSKILSRGGNIQDVDFAPILKRLKDAVEFAKTIKRIEPNELAWKIWDRVYPELSEGKPGLLAAVTSRSEAQVMRLACLYALLDCSHTIKAEHLKSALALWDYCYSSANYIFGKATGNPVADEIQRALKDAPDGMTKTQISNLLGRNKDKNTIDRALSFLTENGLAFNEKGETGGRPIEKWFTK